MTLIMLLCSSVLLLYLIKLYKDYKKRDKLLSEFSTPPGYFFFGNTFQMNTKEKILSSLRRYQDEYGETVRLKFGPFQILVTADVDFLEALLLSNTSNEKSQTYNFFRRWMGTSMAIINGEKWSKLRKSMEPAFRLQVLKNFIPAFSASTQIFLKKIEATAGDPFDLQIDVETLLLDITCATILGYELKSQEYGDKEYRTNMNFVKSSISERFFSPIKWLDFLHYSTSQGKKEIKAVNMVREFSQKIIANRRKHLEDQKNKTTLIDLLFEVNLDGRQLTDEEINDEVNAFIFAGHDTGAVLLSYFFYLLAKHPEIQEKVVDELKTILSDNPMRELSYEDLLQMRYLKMVFYETMRMCPPVSAIFRTLLEDLQLSCGRLVPKGTQVIVSISGVHRNPKVYPDPERFDPERFSPEARGERSSCSFLAFSAGQRSCLGQKYEIMEIKVIVAEVLRKFEVLPVEGHRPQQLFDVVIKTTNGLPVRFVPRKLI